MMTLQGFNKKQTELLREANLAPNLESEKPTNTATTRPTIEPTRSAVEDSCQKVAIQCCLFKDLYCIKGGAWADFELAPIQTLHGLNALCKGPNKEWKGHKQLIKQLSVWTAN